MILLHDLVDSVKPGDDVVLVGRLLRRWRSERVHMRCDVEHVLLCQSAIVSGGEDKKRLRTIPPNWRGTSSVSGRRTGRGHCALETISCPLCARRFTG